MNGIFLPDGLLAMAEMLAGSNIPINGMYAEYAKVPQTAIRQKDFDYFQQLRDPEQTDSGYARIAVSGYEIDKKRPSVTFTGLLTKSDFTDKTPPEDAVITAVTLCYMKSNNSTEDRLIYTLILPDPIKIVDGALLTIRTCLAFGSK